VAFSGTNSAQFDNYTGTVNIPSGATLLFSGGTGNTLSSANPVFIINGTLQPLNAGNTIQLGAFSGSGAIAGPQTNSGAGDTLYVIGGNDTSATFGGVISSNSAVAGSQVIVNKIGAGTLTLSGGSTFTGGTTVSGGTLSISNTGGTATGTGDLEIFSGATLTGRGIIASATTVDNGATLAPGNPSGTLTISNSLTLNDNSILQFGLGTNSDSVLVSGDLALTGLLTVTNSGGFGAGSYTLFTCGGAVSFGNLQLVAAPSGFNYSFDTNTPGVIKLVAAPLTPPIIGGPSVIGGKFVFSGSGGTPGATYYVVTTTNLATPAFNWIPILTNQFDTNGDFAVTNGPATNARSFYRLQLQ
jgi:fibronectin-binding autotransporter adhesin